MTENPYLDHIRREAYDEAQDWRNRAEEIGQDEDNDYTEEDVKEIADDLEHKIERACEFRDEYVKTLPHLLTCLAELSAEWRERSRHTDDIEESFWSQMDYVAANEMEKVQFILEEYLL